VPNTTGLHASVFGKWYKAYGTAYTGAPAKASWDNARTTCISAGGKMATFKDQYQQWVVESILFPNSSAGTVDSYWVGDVYKGTEFDGIYDNVTWYWTDTFQAINSYPSDNNTRLYSRWGAGEPTLRTSTGSYWCARAIRGLAFDTVGPWPDFERIPGNMSVWGWGASLCSTSTAYICELKCEWPLLLYSFDAGVAPHMYATHSKQVAQSLTVSNGRRAQTPPAHPTRRHPRARRRLRPLPRPACPRGAVP
jgi:hypothetical protein